MATIFVCLVVTADDHTGHVVRNVDRLRARKRLLSVGVSQIAPTQLCPIETLDLPPVCEAIFVLVVVVQRNGERVRLVVLELDVDDVRFSEIEVRVRRVC